MRLTQVLGGAGLLVLGALAAWFLKPDGEHSLQVTGDPPITVSDGSLHAHSLRGWRTNGLLDKTIQPPPGKLSTSCGMKDSSKQDTALSLWADDQIFDIALGATIKIYHDPDKPSDPTSLANSVVTITVPNDMSGGDLTITTTDGYFEMDRVPKNGKHNRSHSRPGEVHHIEISNPAKSWTPVNPHNPHFSLLFCYQ